MKSIAFTFDDGPNTTVTPLVAELFEEYGGRCTFFLIGSNINEESIKVSKRAFKAGHEIANHSFTHTGISELDDESFIKEVEDTDELIRTITGREADYFRPPYIDYNEKSFRLCSKTFIEGLGCNDWDPKVDVETRISEILSFADDGVIVLLHDQADNFATVEALKVVLPHLIKQGYEFVTLSELFKRKHRAHPAHEGVIYSRVPEGDADVS